MDSDHNKTIIIASDHNGNAARNYINKLFGGGRTLVDHGPTEEQGKADYPVQAAKVCRSLISCFQLGDPDAIGILICGTGTGMCIAANSFKEIRAALVTDRATAALAREHNNANVLVLGQWRTPLSQMEEIVQTFLDTPYGGGRHDKRLEMLRSLRDGHL